MLDAKTRGRYFLVHISQCPYSSITTFRANSNQIEQVGLMTDPVNEKFQKILDNLFNEKVDSRHIDIRGKRQEGTGKWLLESTQFNKWMRGESGSALLWAHGIGSFKF
jgi:hypothetical protein